MNASRRTLLALLGITLAGVAPVATPVASFAAEPAGMRLSIDKERRAQS
jgi:hypothetical protein